MHGRDPLRAVPVATVTRVEPLPAGPGLLLIRADPPRGRFSAWLERRFGLARERRFELDAVGARFFREIDGSRSLAEIKTTLVQEFALDERAARKAVITFTSGLMRRGLLALKVDG